MENPDFELLTRLQSRVDAQDEKIQNLSVAVHELSASVSSVKEILKGLPDSIEQMMTNLLKQQGKRTHSDDGSVFTRVSGSGHKTPDGKIHFDDSIFSLPKVKLSSANGNDPRGLQCDIQNWVRALNPNTCDQAMEYARNVEIATGGVQDSKGYSRNRAGVFNGYGPVGNGPNSFNKYGPFNTKPYTSCYPNTPNSRPIPNYNPVATKSQPLVSSSGTHYLTKQELEGKRKGEEVGNDCKTRRVEAYLEAGIGVDELNMMHAMILSDGGSMHHFLSKTLTITFGLNIKTLKKLESGYWVWIMKQCENVSARSGSFLCMTQQTDFGNQGTQEIDGRTMVVTRNLEAFYCLATHMVSKHGRQIRLWLIAWESDMIEETNCNDAYTDHSQFLSSRLEDKPILHKDGN